MENNSEIYHVGKSIKIKDGILSPDDIQKAKLSISVEYVPENENPSISIIGNNAYLIFKCSKKKKVKSVKNNIMKTGKPLPSKNSY